PHGPAQAAAHAWADDPGRHRPRRGARHALRRRELPTGDARLSWRSRPEPRAAHPSARLDVARARERAGRGGAGARVETREGMSAGTPGAPRRPGPEPRLGWLAQDVEQELPELRL